MTPQEKYLRFVKPTDDAFDHAIDSGRLSARASDKNYAGHYMYMGNNAGLDMFKHIVTRQYLP